MSSTSRTLKRLGVASVGACTLLSTPYLGAAVAFAATPSGAATVSITSQVGGTASTKADGFDSLVKISANVSVPGSGETPVASVRFSYTPIVIATDLPSGPTVTIGSPDTTAPYSATFTAADTSATIVYRELAEALSAAGTVIGASSDSQDVSLAAANSSVHIAAPAEGAQIGRTKEGNIIVSGTRSADLPALDISAQTRDNSDGSLSDSPATVSVVAGTVTVPPAAPASNAWAVVLPVTACPAGAGAAGCDVVINATTTSGATGDSDEVTEAHLYDAVLTTFTVAPSPSITVPINTNQSFVVTAKDQNGAVLGGVPVTVVEDLAATEAGTVNPPTNGGTAAGTATGASGTTGTDGLFTFRSTDGTAETTNFKITSGDGVPAVDFTINTSMVTYTSTPKTPTLTITPTKTLYASQTEYTADTPVTDVCITDQLGNQFPNSNAEPANLVVSVTRTSTSGTTVTGPTTVTSAPGALAADGTAGRENCYVIPHAAASGDFGNDVFKAYFENNGAPGFQGTGTSADVAATDVTANFATLTVTGLNTQAVKGTNVTVDFTVAGMDGTPFVGRKLSLGGLSGSENFPTTQPATTTRNNATSAVCVTDSAGLCAVTVTDPVAEDVTVYAYDNITDATLKQIGTGEVDGATVSFRNLSVALKTLYQDGLDILQPHGNTSPGHIRPGDVGQYYYQLQDANPNSHANPNAPALANVSVTLTVDNGFFTPECPWSGIEEDPVHYENCTFNPAPADGAVTGKLKSLGKTITLTSDDYGYVTFALAEGRDTLFDVNGTVPVIATAVANGGTAKTSDAASNPLDPFTTNGIEVANGGTVTLLPGTAPNALSGDVQSNGSNILAANDSFIVRTGSNFVVHVTDQFGNLVELASCAVDLTVTGGGYLGAPGNTTDSACGSFTSTDSTNHFNVDSDSTSTTGQSNTVTATWDAPVTTFKADVPAPTPPTPPTFTTPAGTAVSKTDSFTINLYAVDQQHLHFVFANTPAGDQPINTAITTSVTVTDQKTQPVQGLCTHFLRSGPGSQSGEAGGNDIFGNCTLRTNSAGKAGFSYSSTTPGTATVTAIVSDNSGNELSRGVVNTTFTSGTPVPTALSILGGDLQRPLYGSTFVISGTAPASTVVVLHFHKRGTAGDDYSILRSVTASSSGTWTRPILANTDYRYFATDGSATSNNVLFQPRPAVNGPLTRVVAKNHTTTISGTSVPGVTVYVHFHKAGTAASDYSIVRGVPCNSSGVWTKSFLATVDYRLFASRDAGDSVSGFTTYLVQAR